MDKFKLADAFLATSEPLAMLKLCEARLELDARYPWVVLIPRRAGARELEHLSAPDRARLMDEILAAGSAVRAIGAALGRPVEKLNVAQLGNVTPQLHVHVIGRRADDDAWPNPVWARGERRAYDVRALEAARSAALDALKPAQAAA